MAILRFAYDLPNVCTLLGLLSALAGIRFAIMHDYGLALFCALWSVNFDFFDGMVARLLPNRSSVHREFGGQLDSLVDVVHGGVLPAVLLLSLGEFNPAYLPGAFAIIAATVLRLSYFNISSNSKPDFFTGLPVYYNSLVMGFSFLLSLGLKGDAFATTLYIVVILLALANVSSVKIPKQRGWLLRSLIGITTGLSLAYLVLPVF